MAKSHINTSKDIELYLNIILEFMKIAMLSINNFHIIIFTDIAYILFDCCHHFEFLGPQFLLGPNDTYVECFRSNLKSVYAAFTLINIK